VRKNIGELLTHESHCWLLRAISAREEGLSRQAADLMDDSMIAPRPGVIGEYEDIKEELDGITKLLTEMSSLPL